MGLVPANKATKAICKLRSTQLFFLKKVLEGEKYKTPEVYKEDCLPTVERPEGPGAAPRTAGASICTRVLAISSKQYAW